VERRQSSGRAETIAEKQEQQERGGGTLPLVASEDSRSQIEVQTKKTAPVLGTDAFQTKARGAVSSPRRTFPFLSWEQTWALQWMSHTPVTWMVRRVFSCWKMFCTTP
jgi:hypothetical protein